MKRKYGIHAFIFMLLCVLLTACKNTEDTEPEEKEEQGAVQMQEEQIPASAIPVKIANFFGDGHPINVELFNTFKPLFESKTDGRYHVEIYSDSVLGGETELTEAAKIGTLEMVTCGVQLSDEFPRLKVVDFPWLFDDVDTSCTALNDPEIIQAIDSDVESLGLTCKGFVLNGVRSISNNKREITGVDDCLGIKLRVPKVSQFIDNAEALGFQVDTLSMPEIYTALKQGVIDGQDNPPTTLLTSGWYDVQDYLALTRHQITYQWLAVNRTFYEQMPKEDQAIFDECCQIYVNQVKERYKETETENLKALKESGMKITEVDREEFRAAGQGVIEKYCEMYPEFEELLLKLREKGAD